MPPKVARGRKKAVVEKMKSADIPSKEKNSNGYVEIEASETVEKKSNDTRVLNDDSLNKINTKKFANGESQINGASEDCNLIADDKNKLESKEVPLKRGRPKKVVAEASEESPNNPKHGHTVANKSESPKSDVLNAGVSKDIDKIEPDTKIDISDDKNKLESKEVPLKRGRPRKVVAQASEESPNNPKHEHKVANKSESPKSDVLNAGVSKDNDKIEPGDEVGISDNKNKLEKQEVPLKRGRPKKVFSKTSEESLDDPKHGHKVANSNESPDAYIPDASISKDNEKIEPDTKIDISDDKNKLEKQEVPLKRGRPRKVISKTSEESLDEQIADDKNKLENKEVPLKRDRLRRNVAITYEESPDEKLQTEEKVQSHRGRKKAEKKDVKEEESSSVTELQKCDESIPSEEQKFSSKHGRKRGDQKETVKDLNDKESNEGVKEPSEDLIDKEKSGRNTKAVEANKNDEEESEEFLSVGSKRKNDDESEELLSVGGKRKNETSAEDIEKNKSDFNETKVLKVALQRSVSIDKMFEEQTKVTEKGGAKNAKAGGKRAKGDNADSQESGEKSPKIPKGESKSKGQSKKDKMPDVTLLDFSNNSTSPSGKPWNLKISSWNVNGVRAWLEKDGLAYITREDPDIMAFQETKCSDKMLPSEVNITGYHSYWLAGDKDGYSGVGLLSKKEPISVKYGIGIQEHDNEGRVITAEYETFYLVTTYVPNSGRGLVRLNYRMQWDKDFRSYLKSLDEKKPVVLCGDLNVAHEEIDLANPKNNKRNAGFTKEEREGFSTLLSEGFIDSFRHLYPDEKGAYTFWTYMMNARAKNVGWRLDYFVLSKKFTDHLCDNVIRKDVFGSDHCPITLFLYV